MTGKLLPFPGPVEQAFRALLEAGKNFENSGGPQALIAIETEAVVALEKTPVHCVTCRKRITEPLDLVLVRKARQFRWCLFRCVECARTAD